ncbi:MAG: chromosomal replication initiator protein DnaA [Anaerolineae bacterium]|nr:chromosomal replication initiator protein DnaA [Anaerolineae bacterium]
MTNTSDRQDKLTPLEAWQATLGELQLQLAKSTFDAWLKDTTLVAAEDGVYTIGARNSYARDWLDNRMRGLVKRTLTRIVGRQVDVRFIVDAKPVESPAPRDLIGYDPTEDAPARGNKTNGQSCALNPRYTFESFVVSAGSRVPFEISRAVSERPGMAYNPLFLYGGVGLGKTHLLHAIGLNAAQRGLNVLYVPSEQFTNDLVCAIRARTTEEFRNKYRSVDMLLLDDVQFIAGKDASQEEFFHTFNALHSANRQIVVACDRPPRDVLGLDERLRSRFEGGLVVEIAPPDFAARIAILQAKAAVRAWSVPMPVLELIAQTVETNVRELEGALNRVIAQWEALKQPPTLETTQAILKDMLPGKGRPSPEAILQAVADYFGVDPQDLLGASRRQQIALPRQIVMYLLCAETDLSLAQVGAFMGKRDHTTVLHGRDKIRDLMETDAAIRLHVQAIRERLRQPVAVRQPA